MLSTCEGVKTSEEYHDAFPYFSLSVALKTSKLQSQITQSDFPVSNMHVAACAFPVHQRYFPAQTLLVSNEAYVVKTTLNTETPSNIHHSIALFRRAIIMLTPQGPQAGMSNKLTGLPGHC